MTWRFLLLVTMLGAGGQAAEPQPEYAAGRTCYNRGEFRKAAAHFHSAAVTHPDDADAWYWAGTSYERLADIAMPFGARYNAKARLCLRTAMNLSPNRGDYREAFFEFLLNSADSSRTALTEAAGILLTIPESDPDYSEMSRRLYNERKTNSSAEMRIGRVFLVVPRACYRVASIPVPAQSSMMAFEGELRSNTRH